MSDPFATAGELSQLIGQTEPSDLSRMQMFLEIVSAEIRGYTEQVLSEVQDELVTFEPTWSQTLYLPERPVTAVGPVTVKAVATTDYRLVDERKLVRGSDPNVASALDWSFGATVTYTHGYAEGTEAYKSIKKICLEAAANAFAPAADGGAEVFGPPQVLESAGFAPAVFLTQSQKMRLDQFKPVAVG